MVLVQIYFKKNCSFNQFLHCFCFYFKFFPSWIWIHSPGLPITASYFSLQQKPGEKGSYRGERGGPDGQPEGHPGQEEGEGGGDQRQGGRAQDVQQEV